MARVSVCGEETYKVIFGDAVVKTYVYSEKCLKEYFKPGKRFRLWIQKRFEETDGWLD